jgi:hypothetical protein
MTPTLAHPDPRRSRGRALRPLAALALALAASAGARASDPVALSRAAFDRAAAARLAGDLPGACAAFAEAVSLLPAWPLARFEHAQCLRLVTPASGWSACVDPTTTTEGCLTRRAVALEALDAAARGGIRSPAVLVEMARVHEDAGELPAARASYQAALEAFPAEVRASEGMARTAPSAAVERSDLEAWLARSPQDPAALWRLAEVCEELSDVGCAESAWLRFADRAPLRARAASLLRAFAERTGSRAAAERARRLESGRPPPRERRRKSD